MKTLDLINARAEDYQGPGFRQHLGASIIGAPCVRQSWYVFRWAWPASFKGRMLRLFERGNREESVIINNMCQAGIHVLDVDPHTGKQFRITDHDGHFGGSLDAKIYDPPEYPHLWVLGEFKTHNDKSFKKLKKEGLKKSKPSYWTQAHIYMHYENLPVCLHFNVNKNDDDTLVLEIEYDDTEALKAIDRAHKVIYSPVPPPRPPNASPAWFICKWCDYQEICHFHTPKAMNCRTCINAQPVDEGRWHCNHFGVYLEFADQLKGCLEHTPIVED